MSRRPVLYVLAGVNGAGKSSIGGYFLTRSGLSWFNPDAYARALVYEHGFAQSDASGLAGQEGFRRLRRAAQNGHSYAFETTLGGDAIVQTLIEAAATHDILVWYCGLRSPEQHIARVKLRVTQGGHAIPEDKIRQRWVSSLHNLILLLPYVADLRVYDNSRDVAGGEAIPDPGLVLCLKNGECLYPVNTSDLIRVPDWAKPVVEASMSLSQKTAKNGVTKNGVRPRFS